MSTRRIIACACALALTVPAAASARPGFDAPAGAGSNPGITYGSTEYDQQNQNDLGPTSQKANVYVPPTDTASVSAAPAVDKPANVYVPPVVDKPATVAAAPKGDTKNDIAPAISQRHRVVVPAGKSAGKIVVVNPQHHTAPSAGSADDGTDGWKIAAVAEAGLIAAIAMGGAVAVAGQMRPRRRVTTA
jgi:hypothetical protein